MKGVFLFSIPMYNAPSNTSPARNCFAKRLRLADVLSIGDFGGWNSSLFSLRREFLKNRGFDWYAKLWGNKVIVSKIIDISMNTPR